MSIWGKKDKPKAETVKADVPKPVETPKVEYPLAAPIREEPPKPPPPFEVGDKVEHVGRTWRVCDVEDGTICVAHPEEFAAGIFAHKVRCGWDEAKKV